MYICECLNPFGDVHVVASDEEWISLNSFRDRFHVNGMIVNKGCQHVDYEPDDVHAETLNMLLVERK